MARSRSAAIPGEIWIRSPTVMPGYGLREEASTEVLAAGWYRTGDGGYLDDEGFLFLTDRIKAMIVSGGENIYPVEVEEALRSDPAIPTLPCLECQTRTGARQS
jgi:acyl-CoA synthetase (AMP-forming)/AMP-acid ligase II